MRQDRLFKGLAVILMSTLLFHLEPAQASARINGNETTGPETQEVQPDLQEPEAAPAPEEGAQEEALSYVIPEDASEPNRNLPQHIESEFTQDTVFSQSTLKGIISSSELYFFIPDYWETQYVYVELQYTASQLVMNTASSLTFFVNNVPVSSVKVGYEGGSPQIVYVEIPIHLLKEGFNSFTVSAYARLYNEEGCYDDFSNANWLSISDLSYIRCGYQIKEHGHKLSYYPYPFMSTTDSSGKGLTIAVSDQATNQEVAAAMNLMADLSGETEEENQIQFSLYSDINKKNTDRTILVSEFSHLPAAYQSMIRDKASLSDAAVILFTDDEKGNPLLLITSQNDKCLMEAAYLLMDQDRVSQEKSNMATVNLGSAEAVLDANVISPMRAGNYTLREIAGGGLSFSGPFHQEQLVYLPVSEDYILADSGKVTVKFRYSDNLDFTRSLITVYWGNIPVASKKLDKEKSSGDELTFSMPADVVGTSAGAIRIAFDLEIKDLLCTPRKEQVPWAYVSEDSTFNLPASTEIVLSFDFMPSPFKTNGTFNDTVLMLSDQPTTQELNLCAQLIGMYGKSVNPYGILNVKRASEFSKDNANYNIITAGTYMTNSLFPKVNDKLSFQYSEDGGRFENNEQLILSDQLAKQAALLQLIESPFAENRGILAVTGITQESLDRVEVFIRQEKLRNTLTKDCVLIDSDLDIKAYQFIRETDGVEPPTIMGKLAQNKQSVLFTVVATSVMLMLLIAVIIILIRIRMYDKKKED